MLEVITIGEVVETASIVIPVTRSILENWVKEKVLPPMAPPNSKK